jgi:uncharacterized protein (TIGR02996 family)
VARFEKAGKVFEITSADGRYATEQRRHLREGWIRVADPRCEVPLGAEPINPTLEEALRGDARDIGAAIVYADWLQQQGHPRGALITVQHRLSTSPHDMELVEAERKIVEEAKDSLLSKPLLAHLAIDRAGKETTLSRNLYDGGQITFDHGFIRRARLELKRRGGDEDLLWELLRHPSARVLDALELNVDQSRDIALVIALLTHGPRPPLRSLVLRSDHRGTVDLAGLDAAFPLLEELVVEAHNHRFGALDLPRLRRLDVRSPRTDLSRLLAAHAWPALESLAIADDHEKYRLAFERPTFPKLRELVFVGPLTDEDAEDNPDDSDGLFLCQMLVRSPAAPQIERIELAHLSIGYDACMLLVQHRERLARLVELDLPHTSTVVRGYLRQEGMPLR